LANSVVLVKRRIHDVDIEGEDGSLLHEWCDPSGNRLGIRIHGEGDALTWVQPVSADHISWAYDRDNLGGGQTGDRVGRDLRI